MTIINERIAARAAAAVERTGSQAEAVKGGGGDKTFKTAPEGKHKARLIGYVELGKHKNRYDESKPDNAQFILRFALFGKDCAEEDGKPITIDTKKLTVSRHEKATAIKLFKQMCPKRDADHFMQLINRVFWLEISHNVVGEGEKKKTYANIDMAKLLPGEKDLLDDDDNVIGKTEIACAEADPAMFHIFEWDVPSKEDFESLKPWDKSAIREATNFAGSALSALVGEGNPAAADAPEDEPADEPEDKPVASEEPNIVLSDNDMPLL